MTRPRRHTRPIVLALCLNAALLLAILAILLARGAGAGLPDILPAAYAGPPISGQPIAGGGTVYLMPGQLSMNTWGCYLMDTDKQTLCVYQFLPGEKQLRFVAARNFTHDLRMKIFNTIPDPLEVKDLNDRQASGARGTPRAQSGDDDGGDRDPGEKMKAVEEAISPAEGASPLTPGFEEVGNEQK